MNKSQELLARREAVVSRGLSLITPATVASASGATMVDLDGRELIDFAGGIGVANGGHCPPAVVAAIREQAGRYLHTCIHVTTYEPYVALCEKLVELFPHGGAAGGTKVMLNNCGAEAVENAVKIARQSTGRPGVICFSEAFHGRTLMALTLTSKVGYKAGCGPFAPEVHRLPFPNHFRYGDGLPMEAFVARELRRLRAALTGTIAADQVAAIIVEPVQGEGGFVALPAEYALGLRRLCDEHGIVLIFDEVQTGFGRTGRWAAYQHLGVTPDLSTWAKSMGGGLPIAAVVGRADIMDAPKPGTLGGTYAGNPVACAAALANIRHMEEQNICGRADRVGRCVRERLTALQKRCGVIGDVRGPGAMVAMEFVEGGDPNRPLGDLVKQIVAACFQRGLIVLPAGSLGNIIRILCPLVITDDQLDRGLTILEEEVVRLTAAAGAPRRPVAAGAQAPA